MHKKYFYILRIKSELLINYTFRRRAIWECFSTFDWSLIVRVIFSEGGNVTLAFSEGLFSNCSRTVLPIEDHEDAFTCLTYDIITSSRGKSESFSTHTADP